MAKKSDGTTQASVVNSMGKTIVVDLVVVDGKVVPDVTKADGVKQ